MINLLTTSDYWGDLGYSIIISLLTSIILTIFLIFLRPRIRVSKDICIHRGDNCWIIKVKVVNLSWFSSYSNVESELKYFYKNEEKCEKYLVLERKNGSEKIYLPSRMFCNKNKNEEFAVRLSFKYYGDIKKLNKLVFNINGESNLFNTKRHKTCIYLSSNIKQKYQFETGLSCKAIPIDNK